MRCRPIARGRRYPEGGLQARFCEVGAQEAGAASPQGGVYVVHLAGLGSAKASAQKQVELLDSRVSRPPRLSARPLIREAELEPFVIDQTRTVFGPQLVEPLRATLEAHGGTAGLLRQDAGPLSRRQDVDAFVFSLDNELR